jgi:hypothetical protein
MAFTPTGRQLVTGMRDTTLSVWDLVRTGNPKQSASTLLGLWNDLADDDPAKAYRAMHALANAGAPGVAFLKDHLPPASAVDSKRVEKLIADLDSDQFAVRDAAAKELTKLGEGIAPLLNRALEGQPPREARRGIEAILNRLEAAPSGETLRPLRAIQALEYAATLEAGDVLRKLAEGAPVRQTREAKAVLERLAKRPVVAP